MPYESFADLEREADSLCEQNRFLEALALLEQGALSAELAQESEFMIAWKRARVCTMCGKYDECLDIIGGIVEKGYAFPLSFQRFEPLRGKPGYKEIHERNSELLKKLNAASHIEYDVRLPESFSKDESCPLFVALHGHGICNIAEFSAYWKPDVFLKRGFIFVYLQSSQALCHNGFGWMDDYEKSNRDIKECIEAVMAQYPVDKSAVMVGGFSGGAIASVNFAMSGILPVKGFICVCTEEKPPAFTPESVGRAAREGMRGVFMEGELALPVADEDDMLAAFRQEGLPCVYYINKGIGHETPDDLDEKLEKALDFILGKEGE